MVAMRVECFEDTERLDDRMLRTLLASGQTDQRVWAAWRIGLRVGAMPQIVDHVAREPSAGVRRALLVVLAGHGELDVLVALARHDPAMAVRSHASQIVAGLAAQGAIASVVVTEAYAAGPTEIRVAILRGIPPGGPEPLSALIDAALEAGSPEEQLEAFDVALDDPRAPVVAAALRWLDSLAAEASTDAWVRVLRRSPAHIVALLRGAPPTLRARAVQALVAIPIAALAELVGEEPEVFAAVRSRHDVISTPPALIVRAFLAGHARHFIELLTAQLAAMQLAPAPVAEALPTLHAHASGRLAEIRLLGRGACDGRLDYRWWRREYTCLLNEVDRLLRVTSQTTSPA